MAKFLKHESCPQCGSRDNLGRYSDGSAWCFGCGYYERSDTSPFVGERNGKTEEYDDGERVCFPDDATNTLDGRGCEWLAKYGLTAVDAIKAGFKWSPQWEQLLMPFYGEDDELCCIQAKNFNPKRASKAKYYNIGEKAKSRTIYGSHGGLLVLTEDAVSALVVSRIADAKPLLGTSISRYHLSLLKGHYNALAVWLDNDKWREAREIADAAKLLGLDCRTVFTEKDPKEYSLDEIRKFVA